MEDEAEEIVVLGLRSVQSDRIAELAFRSFGDEKGCKVRGRGRRLPGFHVYIPLFVQHRERCSWTRAFPVLDALPSNRASQTPAA